jgi:hypothetical protein
MQISLYIGLFSTVGAYFAWLNESAIRVVRNGCSTINYEVITFKKVHNGCDKFQTQPQVGSGNPK